MVAVKVGCFVAKETAKFTCKKVTQIATLKGATQATTKIAQVGKQLAAKEASLITREGVALSHGAESVNAAANLNRKLSRLEKFQETAAKTRILPDGRIRYYSNVSISKTPGPTRGACGVLEWNSKTGNVGGGGTSAMTIWDK